MIERKLIARRFKKIREKGVLSGKKFYKKTTDFLKRRPMASFFIALGLLLGVLLLSKITQQAALEKPKENVVKSVSVYSIGEAPKATFQAKIEKSGVVKIIAQTPGIVQTISVSEGDSVWAGQQILSLSSNYQGGNAATVQRQIAQVQYQNVLDTFDQQKELIQKQRDIANMTDENADKLRDISRESLDETNGLIDSNQGLLDTLNQNVLADDVVTRGSINQLQGGINQLREAVRSIDYSVSGDNPPAKLSDLQKDIAIKQLAIQEKSLELTKEVSRLQVSLAYIAEATMYPASPFSGTVERVSVTVGQSVNPGTLLATITSDSVSATAVLNVPQAVAQILVRGVPSELIVGDKKSAITPYYVSSQATDGQLYAVLYDIPQAQQNEFTDGEFVQINVPINVVDTTATDPFIPIDAVYQSQDQAFVLVATDTFAKTKIVKLGKVYGNYVEALTGLTSGDQIILDRNVIAGDTIKIQSQ